MNARIVTFSPRYAKAYAALNYQWIEQYFEVEEEDRKALERPEAYVLARGGQIFFVLVGEEVVGTVAMVPFQAEPARGRVFELAKMAVHPEHRGQGYSVLLMQACIDFAMDAGADEIMLVTNDILKPALGLYTASGFEPVENSDLRYARSNLEMRLRLAKVESSACI